MVQALEFLYPHFLQFDFERLNLKKAILSHNYVNK